MQKRWLFAAVFLLLAPCGHAQFGWDEESVTDTDVDQFNTALRTPAIEPLGSAYFPTFDPPPVTRPAAAPFFQPFVAPAVEVDPLVEQCDLEPEAAQAYRAAEIVEEDADCPEHRSGVRSGWIPQAGPVGRHERERRSQFLGRLSANPYAADSTANPYSAAGSPYSSKSVNNPFGPYGSPYSSTSARNPYATDAPKIVAQDGTYLGELSDNPYDPDSVANPYGRYGSPYSSTSINNPYSTYGSPFSSQSPNNPYATQAPLLFGD